MTKIIRLASGQSITVRKPTEAEALAFADKRQDAQDPDRAPQDACDDGDEELLACVTSPSREEVEEILEDFPLAIRHIADAVRELGGDALQMREDPSLVSEEMRTAHGKRLIGLRVGEEVALVLRKVGRVEMKFLQRDCTREKRSRPSFAQLAALAKEHVISGASAGIWEKYPFLSANLGLILFLAASVRAESESGKS